jgi:endonuclease/exonuclease/phosphatase family metal-dependent hydrolase
MKIATWNINECVGITCNLDNQKTVNSVNKKNIDEIINIVNEADFDIICFQEYPVYINDKLSLTKRLLEETNMKYYEEYDTYDSYLFKGGRVGVAIFSKFKIIDTYKTLFNNPHMAKKSSNGTTYYSFDKPIIKVKVEIDGNNYTIITGHAIAFAPFDKTEFDYPESYKPLEQIIKDSLKDNLIVLGDFNSERIFDLLPNIKDDVTDVINFPTTKDYYENRGEVQMDYILINDKLIKANNYKIDNFSDHYVIGSEITIKG